MGIARGISVPGTAGDVLSSASLKVTVTATLAALPGAGEALAIGGCISCNSTAKFLTACCDEHSKALFQVF